MINVLIISGENDKLKELTTRLGRSGYLFSVFRNLQQVAVQEIDKPPDLILAEVESSADIRRTAALYPGTGAARTSFLTVIIPAGMLNNIADEDGIDDFIVRPYHADELSVRLRRLIRRKKNTNSRKVIERGDLVINTSSCEVIFNGKLIELTFREYELLRFLATNKGHVFSREELLNKVWKYDYLGGERTVDVHIRRLRGKIEDAEHSFIDTVRNIGYRFRINS
ncbi:winged helix-turn-helix domain-containing protein [Chloroflexota bacterium]